MPKSRRAALIHGGAHGKLSRPKWRIETRAHDAGRHCWRISAVAPTMSRDPDYGRCRRKRDSGHIERLARNWLARANANWQATPIRVRMENCTPSFRDHQLLRLDWATLQVAVFHWLAPSWSEVDSPLWSVTAVYSVQMRGLSLPAL